MKDNAARTIRAVVISLLIGLMLGSQLFYSNHAIANQGCDFVSSLSSLSSSSPSFVNDGSPSSTSLIQQPSHEQSPVLPIVVEDSTSTTTPMAFRESFGFFDDISNEEWTLLRQKTLGMRPNTNGNPYATDHRANTNYWFQNHYEPDFACRHEQRIGRLGDGGKWVCDPHRLQRQSQRRPQVTARPDEDPTATTKDNNDNGNKTTASSIVHPPPPPLPLPPPCLVYSIGSNGDASFEADIQKKIGRHCEIHVFDMANWANQVSWRAPGAHFHQWGISNTNNTQGPNQVYKTLLETMAELGHVGRPIDIFKIDCEGCEWQIYHEFFQDGVDLRQILIEVHGVPKSANAQFASPSNMVKERVVTYKDKDGTIVNRTIPMKYRGGYTQQTGQVGFSYKQVKLPETPDFFLSMQRHGYVIFHKEPNIQWALGAHAIEYCFLKLHADFVNAPTKTVATA